MIEKLVLFQMDKVTVQTTRATLKQTGAGGGVARAEKREDRGGVFTRRGTKKGENNAMKGERDLLWEGGG